MVCSQSDYSINKFLYERKNKKTIHLSKMFSCFVISNFMCIQMYIGFFRKCDEERKL